MKTDLKTADCLRTVENWSSIERSHRFDKQSFDKEQVKKDMKMYSPKMDELIKNIRKLDDKDKKESGKLFKHFIFSDVRKGGYGSKIIASGLIANGFNSCFKFQNWASLNIQKPEKHKEKETFGLLSSTAIYNSRFTQKNVKQVLSIYNSRPDNVHGDDMRFIILDSGFKEGIDLFDVKYVHIFEEQTNAANLTQAVGRATRSCGQKGLNFVPNEGWTLHVYLYNLFHNTSTNEEKYLYQDFFEYMGINFEELILIQNLEKLAIATSVDYELNRNIHEFSKNKTRTGGAGGEEEYFGCYSGKCGARSTKTIPFSLIFFEKMYTSYYKKKLNKKENAKISTKDKRDFFCKLLKSDKAFCKHVNEKYMLMKNPKSKKEKPEKPETPENPEKPETPENPEKENQLMLIEYENPEPNTKENTKENMMVMRDTIKSAYDDNYEDMNFQDFQKYIFKTFKKYKYEPLKIKNNCDNKFEETENKKNDERLVTFSESQNFVTKYFTPERNIKGMLIWHSVGTGKTCTALSVKSFLYEKEGYTIIWVTRSTLKDDIWKNMFDKVCDHVIRDRIANGEDIPINPASVRKYVGKYFLPPISYRQFSNLVEGKNLMSQQMMGLNGTREDILRKSLIIVDEAHKLYSKDLVAMERPNMSAITDAIHNSYEVSGANSCKLLLMTATPVADNMMEFFKLTNLLQHDHRKRFPETMEILKEKEIVTDSDFTEKGKTMFQNNLMGMVSYLDRRNDPRQFAQPMFHKVPVKMSGSSVDEEYDDCIKKTNEELTQCLEDVELVSILMEEYNKKLETEKEIKASAKERLTLWKKDIADEKKKLTKTYMKEHNVNVDAVNERIDVLNGRIDLNKVLIENASKAIKDIKNKMTELRKKTTSKCNTAFRANQKKCDKKAVTNDQTSVLKTKCKYSRF
jgi:superfamily II DNA or RNA helicase